MLDRERKQQPTWNYLEPELLVILGFCSESTSDFVTDRTDDTDPHLRPADLTCQRAPS